MDRISYNDIDFNKLTKLDYDSLESDIYIDKEKQKIYKIFKKTFRFTVPVRGAPASNHILYDCQMQNNFLYER